MTKGSKGRMGKGIDNVAADTPVAMNAALRIPVNAQTNEASTSSLNSATHDIQDTEESTSTTKKMGVGVEWSNITLQVPEQRRGGLRASAANLWSSCIRVFSGANSPQPPKETKTLLSNVSGKATPGRLLALMGASGAGKTTLLRILARQYKKESGAVVKGTVTFPRLPVGEDAATPSAAAAISINTGTSNATESRSHAASDVRAAGANSNRAPVVGFVEQQDFLYRELTTEETLWFLVSLHHSKLSPDEKKKRVDQALKEFGLEKCAKTRIGGVAAIDGEQEAGLSGGEKRRLSVALQTLVDIDVLFLDEPTSGLDSNAAYSLVKLLRKLARTRGLSIICTIHQPAKRTFDKFDDLLVLSAGHAYYSGETPTTPEALASGKLRLTLPVGNTIPDFLIHRASKWNPNADALNNNASRPTSIPTPNVFPENAPDSAVVGQDISDTCTAPSSSHDESSDSDDETGTEAAQTSSSASGQNSWIYKKCASLWAWPRKWPRLSECANLLWRHSVLLLRKYTFKSLTFLMLISSVLLGWIFLDIYDNPSLGDSVDLYKVTACILMFLPTLTFIENGHSLMEEWSLVEKEMSNGFYGPTSFHLMGLIVKIWGRTVMVTVLLLPFGGMTGYYNIGTFINIFWLYVVVVLNILISDAVCMLIVLAFSVPIGHSVGSSICKMYQCLGFTLALLRQYSKIPCALRPFYYISFVAYSYPAVLQIMALEMSVVLPISMPMNPHDTEPMKLEVLISSEQILYALELDQRGLWLNMVALGLMLLGCCLLNLGLLHVHVWRTANKRADAMKDTLTS